jgi:hypothetical protein
MAENWPVDVLRLTVQAARFRGLAEDWSSRKGQIVALAGIFLEQSIGVTLRQLWESHDGSCCPPPKNALRRF